MYGGNSRCAGNLSSPWFPDLCWSGPDAQLEKPGLHPAFPAEPSIPTMKCAWSPAVWSLLASVSMTVRRRYCLIIPCQTVRLVSSSRPRLIPPLPEPSISDLSRHRRRRLPAPSHYPVIRSVLASPRTSPRPRYYRQKRHSRRPRKEPVANRRKSQRKGRIP